MQSILARLLVLLALIPALAVLEATAQEAATGQAAEIEAMEPAIRSEDLAETADFASGGPGADSAAEIAVTDPAVSSAATAAEIEATDPGVPSAVLAQDVTRREVASGVMDELDLGRSEITGNQELPTVLYIVPWKKSDPGDLMGKPVNTLLDEVLAPIDRSEFIRQVDYYEDLYGEEEEQD